MQKEKYNRLNNVILCLHIFNDASYINMVTATHRNDGCKVNTRTGDKWFLRINVIKEHQSDSQLVFYGAESLYSIQLEADQSSAEIKIERHSHGTAFLPVALAIHRHVFQ